MSSSPQASPPLGSPLARNQGHHQRYTYPPPPSSSSPDFSPNFAPNPSSLRGGRQPTVPPDAAHAAHHYVAAQRMHAKASAASAEEVAGWRSAATHELVGLLLRPPSPTSGTAAAAAGVAPSAEAAAIAAAAGVSCSGNGSPSAAAGSPPLSTSSPPLAGSPPVDM